MMSSHSPPILVLSRKKPHLIFFQVFVALSGISTFVGDSASEVPDGITRAWGSFLIFSGLISLVAHLQRLDRERGLYVERSAMLLQAGVVLMYVALLVAYIDDVAALVIAFLTAIGWAGANLWEVKLISGDLRMINAVRAVTPNSDAKPEMEVNDAT